MFLHTLANSCQELGCDQCRNEAGACFNDCSDKVLGIQSAKPKARRNKILLINAVDEVTRERAQSFLTDDHIERIVETYKAFKDEPGFARVATLEEIRAKDGNLSIPLYVASQATEANLTVRIGR